MGNETAEQKIGEESQSTGARVPVDRENASPAMAPEAGTDGGIEATSEEGRTDAEKLAAQLEAARGEARENYDRLLRVSAEFENYKKRSAREMEDYRKYANESLLRDLLPVIDNLERALAVPADAQNEKGLREGLELTLKQIHKLLECFGVSAIEAEGQPFDPAFHQAMMQEQSDQVPENVVLRQLQKGYAIKDRLLRPAMVVVAKAAAKSGASPSAEGVAEAQS
jgi:molecular chaperone GrpE